MEYYYPNIYEYINVQQIEITRFYSSFFLIIFEALQRVGLILGDIRQDNIII